MAHFSIGMVLSSEGPYEDVLGQLTDGLSWVSGWQESYTPPRMVALAECGTHAIFAVQVGAYRQSESTLTQSLLAGPSPGMLVLADRGFFSYAL